MEILGYNFLKGIIGAVYLDSEYMFMGAVGIAVLVVISIILLIIQIVKTNRLRKRLDKFLLGREGTSLEQDIIGIIEDNKFLKNMVENNKKDICTLYKRMESAYQKIGLVRYDAFSQMGGQLSFCLALLDENDNGFVLNSVHSTEGCYSYTKEIKAGEYNNPNVTLSEEEMEALSIAKNK